MLNQEIIKYIDASVLCWLATVSEEQIPNVSPKEIFTYYQDSHLLIANIASPQSVKNILANNNVCVSFIDIFVQKGFQLHGTAQIVKKTAAEYVDLLAPLEKMTEGKFPISSIIKIQVTKAKPILAPRYMLHPNTKEADQIKSALAMYNVAALMDR